MEFILELLFEIIVEGCIELGSEKKVPMPLRITVAIVVFTVYLGLGGFFLYTAYTEMQGAVKIFMYALGFFILGGGVYLIYKMFKKKKELQEDDLWNL